MQVYIHEMPLFTRKFNEPKKLRSIRLTDTAWDALERLAGERGMTRTDLLEEWARQLTQAAQLDAENLTRESVQKHVAEILEKISQRQKQVFQRQFVKRYLLDLLDRLFPESE